MSPSETPEPFRHAVRRLREERGLTQDAFVREVAGLEIDGAGSSKVLQSLQGVTRPNLPVMEGVARVLDVPVHTFAEYRLLLARLALDEEVSGLEQAMERLAGAPQLDAATFSAASRLALETAAREAARPRGRRSASPRTRGAEDARGASA